MRKIVLAALVLGSATFATPAHAAEPISAGCAFSSITDPTVENGQTQTGEIDGGPATSDPPGLTVTLTCTIQVGGGSSTHADADSASASDAGEVAVVASVVSYTSPEGQPVYLCEQVDVPGDGTYYWHDADTTNDTTDTSEWRHDDASASCSLAISQSTDPGIPLPVDAVVIIGLPTESEPIHTNVDGWDCGTYTWDGTDDYDVTCTSGATACTATAVVAIGAGGTSACGTPGASVPSPGGAAVDPAGGPAPWHCTSKGTLATPWIVVCAVAVVVV